jgi:hypothetical protein
MDLHVKIDYRPDWAIIKLNIDCIIILVEDFPCERKEQLLAREQYYIDNTICVNRNRSIVDKKAYNKQYKEDHKDEIKIKNKQYKKEHKEEIKKIGKKE